MHGLVLVALGSLQALPPLHLLPSGGGWEARGGLGTAAQARGVRVGGGDAESLTPSQLPLEAGWAALSAAFCWQLPPWSPWLPISRLALAGT